LQNRWRERYPDLEPRLTEARETARRKVLATIKSIGEETNDWRALDTWLQRSFPADYRRDASINVNAMANAQAGPVVISAEKRRKLQEQFAKWQEERAAAEEAEIERRVQARLAGRGAKELPDKS
jgi:hypothetical protein